ncbi:MAG: hypothetical protein ACHBMF_00760 [Chromatiales bacterium]
MEILILFLVLFVWSYSAWRINYAERLQLRAQEDREEAENLLGL